MRKSPKRRVAILYPASAPWIAAQLGGIRRYARAHGNWHLFTSASRLIGGNDLMLTLRAMRGWKGDAIIAASNVQSELRSIQKMGIPAVNLSGHLPKSFGVPRVLVNDYHAGRLAADHLLNRGLRHLAFLGTKKVWYSEQRRQGFRERAAEAGVECELLLQGAFEPSNQSWQERIALIAKWVASLRRPSGVFAVHDFRAQLLMEACQEAELRIPEDIAVIGMDNDETICENSVPTLTSISRNSEEVGWEASALLDRMMQGAPSPTADLLLEPDGVIARQSTDMHYCSDPVAQSALAYMRAQLKTQFNIDQIAKHAGVSKRTLEMRFRENLQCSPHEFLIRMRVQHAQALMEMPEKRTAEQTALECGFGTSKAFYAAFRRVIGESPGAFRKKHLAKNAAPHSA